MADSNTKPSGLEECIKSGSLFTEIESTWEKLTGNSINKTLVTPAFKKNGVTELIRFVNENIEDCEDKSKLLDMLAFLNENKDNLLKILTPDLRQSERIRHSGHFIDQKLKYQQPNKQISIFDVIESNHIRSLAEKPEFEVKSVGIRLTPPEDRLLMAIQKLLHRKSQNIEPDDSDYYKGNFTPSKG